MKLGVYSVFDDKAVCYARPFFATNNAVACRSFASAVTSQAPDNALSANPGDYKLFRLGEFDDSCGSFTSGTPLLLISGDEVIAHGKAE